MNVFRIINTAVLPHRSDHKIKSSLVIPKARGKKTRAVGAAVYQIIPRIAVKLRHHMSCELPIDQILRVQNGDARHIYEGRRGKIKILSYTNDVRIGIISVKRRVRKSAVAAVGLPCMQVENTETKGDNQGRNKRLRHVGFI
jgi:hypothetical protein